MRSPVEIVEVSPAEPDLERLRGCSIEKPKADSAGETDGRGAAYAFEVRGWVLGTRQIAGVELVHDGNRLCRVPLDIERPDVASGHPPFEDAEVCGFSALVNSLHLPLRFELVVRAMLEDETSVEIGTICGRRARLRSGFKPRFRPLMITTLGRTGSTALTRLLETHPQVVVCEAFKYGPRVASYWMSVLRELSEPGSYLLQISPGGSGGTNQRGWWVGPKMARPPRMVEDAYIQERVGVKNLEDLAAFCQGRIDAFYEETASHYGRTDALYFAEKCQPNLIPSLVWELYPDAREVVLVRDFRDVVCSVFAYTAKRESRGLAPGSFGQEEVASEKEYVLQLRKSVTSLLQAWKARSDRVHLVRYEDMILRPQETLSAFFDYLGVGTSPTLLETMLYRLLEPGSDSERHRTTPSPQDSVDRWRQDLDSDLQEVCNDAFGPALRAFGYSLGEGEPDAVEKVAR